MEREGDDDEGIVPLVMASFIPGGKFVVFLYDDGRTDLTEIKTASEDEWYLQGVAQYKQNPEDPHPMIGSTLLTETNLGRPIVASVDEEQECYGPSFMGSSMPH